MELMLTRHSGPETESLIRELKPLYADVYSEPPYEMSDEDIEQFEVRIRRHVTRSEFVLILGKVGGRVAGFTYGYSMAPDQWWTGVATDPRPANLEGEQLFIVIELGVRKEFRGRGYSRQLVDALLTDRPEAWASLISRPGAQAHAMYRRWGWTKVGNTQSYAHWPVEEMNVLRLNDSESA